ncbi:hypothetical protein [Streptomyces noursei]|uniref:hypothetical protein n=1 Tax=Streptomyces noursei TaxID=1971 RepID=UPI001F3110DD
MRRPGPFQSTDAGLLPVSLTDRGMAKTFAHLYAGDYRHVNGLGWYKWADCRWEPDEHDTV